MDLLAWTAAGLCARGRRGLADPDTNRYRRDIASDIADPNADSSARLLLKAVRSLPAAEQDVVLEYLLTRAAPPSTRMMRNRSGQLVVAPGPSDGSLMREADVVLRQLAAGASTTAVAVTIGLNADLLGDVMRDLSKRSHRPERLGAVFAGFAAERTLAQIAADLGVPASELSAELQPTEVLTGAVCAALMARTALPQGPADPGPRGGLARAIPVRFPQGQYDRLKAWCEANGFPMAAVVRGLVDRFLDEHQPS